MEKKEVTRGWIFFLMQLLVLPPLLKWLNGLLPDPLDLGALNVAYAVFCFLATVVIFRRYLMDTVKAFWGQPFPILRWAGIGLIGYYLASSLFALGIARFFPTFQNANDSFIARYAAGILSGVSITLLTPITEEVLYRGLVFGYLSRWGKAAAYCLSVLLFCAIHVVGYLGQYTPGQCVIALLQYLPAGFFLCLSYERSGSVIAPILIHISINQIGMLLLR